MVLSVTASMEVGTVKVVTTSGRGLSPEEITERALERIIYVGGNSHPAIIEQAEAFKDNIRQIVLHAVRNGVVNHNVTLANRLRNAGHPELIPILEN